MDECGEFGTRVDRGGDQCPALLRRVVSARTRNLGYQTMRTQQLNAAGDAGVLPAAQDRIVAGVAHQVLRQVPIAEPVDRELSAAREARKARRQRERIPA